MRFFLLLVLSCGIWAHEQVTLYTYYTPSHEVLFKEWFYPSLPEKIPLSVLKVPQSCKSAQFMSHGWTRTTVKKLMMLKVACEEQRGGVVIYADVDIQFFRPFVQDLLEELQGYDLVIQRDDPSGTVCTGFMAFRANEQVSSVFEEALHLMEQDEKISDQPAINRVLRKSSLRWKLLPKEFFGGGTLTGKHWNPGEALLVPPDIYLHHANWTTGVENKIKQLQLVKDHHFVEDSCHR